MIDPMANDRPLIALTGATGFLGQAVLDAANAAGYAVRALTRRPQPPRPHVQWIQGELADTASLEELAGGAEAMIHAAGMVNAPDPAGFEECNVAGTLNVIETVVARGVPKLIYVSSLSAREPELSAYGASKARAERLVRASPLDWTIVRPPAIYGPRDKEMFELFRAAKWGLVPMPDNGRASLIHVDDLARLLVALVGAGESVAGKMFEPDDGKPGGWEHYEMALAIGWALDKRPKVWSMSKAMLERAAKVDRFLRGTKAKMTADRAAYFSHPDWVVSKEAAVPSTIWRPRIETREGLKATAEWYRENKWL